MFRITQESLSNVGRYANAKTVWVKLESGEEQLLLTIKDDGIGFDKESISSRKTLGILGMKERTNKMKGRYIINSSP